VRHGVGVRGLVAREQRDQTMIMATEVPQGNRSSPYVRF
jgi:hypothetical protein